MSKLCLDETTCKKSHIKHNFVMQFDSPVEIVFS